MKKLPTQKQVAVISTLVELASDTGKPGDLERALGGLGLRLVASKEVLDVLVVREKRKP